MRPNFQAVAGAAGRRAFLRRSLAAAAAAGGAGALPPVPRARSQEPGNRPSRAPGIQVLNPRDRVPVGMIVDDSTCLVNMAHFALPQFAEAWPDRPEYRKDWRSWPREIPDAFVRKFGEWSAENGIRGKYSIVPYPACVGWMDRDLPGWSHAQLQDSLELVRELMVPNWDIHPEMVTHTWVIDTRTGRPLEERSEFTMENWRWTDGKSVDQLADYLSYALAILERAGLPCEGITTPGGFAGRVKAELSQATFEAVRAVYGAEIPHYFKYIETEGDASTQPRVEYAADLESAHPRCVVNVIGGTGDWFGGWDGVSAGDVGESINRFITDDGEAGRMVDLIRRGEPAFMLCHWPGIYCNGQETGFDIFKGAVQRLHDGYRDRIVWMKLSEAARYWAARELTAISRGDAGIGFSAPFAAPDFTVRIPVPSDPPPNPVVHPEPGPATTASPALLAMVRQRSDLRGGTWCRDEGSDSITVCFPLPKGRCRIAI